MSVRLGEGISSTVPGRRCNCQLDEKFSNDLNSEQKSGKQLRKSRGSEIIKASLLRWSARWILILANVSAGIRTRGKKSRDAGTQRSDGGGGFTCPVRLHVGLDESLCRLALFWMKGNF